MYCNAEHLVHLIRQAQAKGLVSEELAQTVARIANGVRRRYRWWQDQDDFGQAVVCRFLQVYQQCDLERPPRQVFNWLTSLAANYGWQKDRETTEDRRKLKQYAVALGDDIPAR